MDTIDGEFPRRTSVVLRMPSAASPSAVWELLRAPARWPAWSPQVRAVTGFEPATRRAVPTVPPLQVGEWVAVHGPWPVRLPARFTRVEPGRRWDFCAPLAGRHELLSAHQVTPANAAAGSFGPCASRERAASS